MSVPSMPKVRPSLRLGEVCLFFAVLTLVLTWPLASELTRGVAGEPGDNLFFVWILEWYRKAILVAHVWAWTVPALNYPEGYSLGYNEYTPATFMLALPVSLLWGTVAGFNAVILSTFVLSGLGVYLFVYRLTASARGGLVAGTIFAFCTYRMNHLGGHISLMGTQWLAFYFLSLHGLLEVRVWSWRRTAVTALFLVLMSMTAPYYLYMSLVLSAVYVLAYLWLTRARVPGADGTRILGAWRWQVVRKFAAVCLLAAPLSLLAFAPYLQLRLQGSFEPHGLVEAESYSASLTDFLVPRPGQLAWGGALESLYHGENALYLGLVALSLAAVALAARRQMPANCGAIALFALTIVGAVVLAMGVSLHWLGAEVQLGIPASLQRWWPHPATFIPLPGYLLYRFVPFYASMRVWMRYGIFVSLFVSVLAGLGAVWLLGRVRPRLQTAAAVLIVALIMLDSWRGPINLTLVQGRPVDAWLAAQPGQGVVATFPFSEAWKPQATFNAGIFDKPYIGGDFTSFHSPQFDRIRPVLETFPDAASVALLKSLGVQYVLVDSSLYSDFPAVRAGAESFGLRLLTAMDGNYVFAMPPP